jgi:histone H3/H4
MATPSKKSARKASGKTVSHSKRAGLVFPVGRIASLLRKGRYAARVSSSAATYLTAVVEYLVSETLDLSAKAVIQRNKGKRITPRALTLKLSTNPERCFLPMACAAHVFRPRSIPRYAAGGVQSARMIRLLLQRAGVEPNPGPSPLTAIDLDRWIFPQCPTPPHVQGASNADRESVRKWSRTALEALARHGKTFEAAAAGARAFKQGYHAKCQSINRLPGLPSLGPKVACPECLDSLGRPRATFTGLKQYHDHILSHHKPQLQSFKADYNDGLCALTAATRLLAVLRRHGNPHLPWDGVAEVDAATINPSQANIQRLAAKLKVTATAAGHNVLDMLEILAAYSPVAALLRPTFLAL